MMMRRALALTAAVALSTAFVTACGDTEDKSGSGSTGGDTAASSLTFTAEDIQYAETDASAAAGDLDVKLVNDGKIEHSWEIEGHEDDLKLHVAKNGDTDDGTITLEPGEYTYYCAVPGHREAGMEGTLTVK